MFRMLQKSTWIWLKVELAAEEGNQGGEEGNQESQEGKQGKQEEEATLQPQSLLRALFARQAPETLDMRIYQDDDY